MATSGELVKMKAGDVVRLKSGGPRMCAEWVDHNLVRPVAHCRWIDARDKVHEAFFKLDALVFAGRPGPTAQDGPQARMAGDL